MVSFPQEAIKVYLVYYSFNQNNQQGQCYLKQEEILERIGLSYAGKNRKKLVAINKILQDKGLIKQYYKNTKDIFGRVIKSNVITVAPLYWENPFYQMMKQQEVKNTGFYVEEYEEIHL